MSSTEVTSPESETVDHSLRRREHPAYSDATRYLCAAAELFDDFSQKVMRELFVRPSRAIAPSYGIDVVPIVKHCVKGQRRRGVRDVAICLLLLVELLLFPIPMAVSALAAAVIAGVRQTPWLNRRVLSVLLLIGVGAAVAWAVFGQVNQLTEAAGVAMTLGGLGRFGAFLVSAGVVLVLSWLIWYAEWHWSWWYVGSQLREAIFEPDAVRVRLPKKIRDRLEVFATQQYGNVTVYGVRTADRLPFVGAGKVGQAWSFAINLQRRADGPSTATGDFTPFGPLDLHHSIVDRLLALRSPEAGAAFVLPGIEMSDHVLVSGWYRLEGKPAYLPFSEEQIPPAEMDRIINGPSGARRHFKCLRVEWQGRELVSTIFLHLATEGRTLYIEFTPCLLSPIKGEYKDVDTWPFPARGDVLKNMRLAAQGIVPILFLAPLRLVGSQLGPYIERRRGELRDRRATAQRHVIDYGARNSVRELGSIEEKRHDLQLVRPEEYLASPRRYLQLLDAEKYTKTIAVQTLDAILDFLEGHDVDTSDFRRRQSAVLNSSVHVGSVQANVVNINAPPGDRKP